MGEHGLQMGTPPGRPGGATNHEPSVAELVKQLSEQSSALARKEVALAKLEMTGKAKQASPDSASEGAQRAAGMAKENPVIVAAGAAFVTGTLFGRLLGRRKYRNKARAKG